MKSLNPLNPQFRHRPRIGITMGDASGIGPEIIVKVLSHPTTYQFCSPIVIGSASIIQHALRFAPHPLKIRSLEPPPNLERSVACNGQFIENRQLQNKAVWLVPDSSYGTIDLLNVSSLQPEDISMGAVHALAGKAAVNAIQHATQLAINGQIDAITTAPICKMAIYQAGYDYPGHTELLGALTNASKVVMMLAADEQDAGGVPLRVSFVTSHLPLAEVPMHLSTEKILDVISVTHDALTRFGITSPRLAVSALNPHAGELGILGTEEAEIIIPAVEAARAGRGSATESLQVEGPFPADVLFVNAREGRWDAVIAMYHDQGNIPIKLMAFGHVVNVTLGLPIIRTSVDHGTAFDIAGQGIASESSLIAALKFAVRLSVLGSDIP